MAAHENIHLGQLSAWRRMQGMGRVWRVRPGGRAGPARHDPDNPAIRTPMPDAGCRNRGR